MTRSTAIQLDKILALVDSDQDGEALAAIRKARSLLAREGLTFGDLARAARRRSFGFFMGGQKTSPAILAMQQKLADLQAELHVQTNELAVIRRQKGQLEQKLGMSDAEAQRWQQLARETVDKLWNLSQPLLVEDAEQRAAVRN